MLVITHATFYVYEMSIRSISLLPGGEIVVFTFLYIIRYTARHKYKKYSFQHLLYGILSCCNASQHMHNFMKASITLKNLSDFNVNSNYYSLHYDLYQVVVVWLVGVLVIPIWYYVLGAIWVGIYDSILNLWRLLQTKS